MSRPTATEPELPPGLLGPASARPGVTYRALRRIWRFVAWLLRARLELEGAEHLPRDAHGRITGGWIAAVMPHRTWIDPFVPWILLPERPRFAFFGADCGLRAVVAPAVADLHEHAAPPPGSRPRGRFLTTLFR